jgi:hypothetical protein
MPFKRRKRWVGRRFMKKTILCGGIWAVSCLVSFAQTNVGNAALIAPPFFHGHWFPPPTTPEEIRPPSRPQDVAATSSGGSDAPAPQTRVAVARESALDNESYRAALLRSVEREMLLRRIPPPTFNSEIGRRIEDTFTPSPMKIGHVHIESSIITAIKKKNPFCLLNPDILHFAW